MIFDRWYDPPDGEVIYHYCRPETFLEIIRTRSIWLTASYTMNDATERAWGYSIFKKAAKELEQETGSEFVSKIAAAVIAGDTYAILMLACFSLDADVLSQWRAYGDDGRGFAIGFSPKITEVPAKPLRVLYDQDAQLQELLGNLRHVYQVEKSSGFRYGEEFGHHMFQLGLDLCAYKNPAFSEEKEIRLAHACGLHRESKRIVPLGARGPEGKVSSEALETRFRIVQGVLVPYVIAEYSKVGASSPIKEVVLGPRNDNAELNVEVFLNTIGVSDVAVRRSKAPYR